MASLAFGLLGMFGGWCVFGVPCALAIVLGHVARSQTKRGLKSGDGMALVGLVLGYVFVVPTVVVSVLWVLGAVFGDQP